MYGAHKKSRIIGATILIIAQLQVLLAIGENTSLLTGSSFFTSYVQPGKDKQQTIYTFTGDEAFIASLPAIAIFGQYSSWYLFFVLYAQIELPWQQIPQPIFEHLTNNSTAQQISPSAIEFNINIFGPLQGTAQDLAKGIEANTFNVLFHLVVRRWRQSRLENFDKPMLAGIFGANGVHEITRKGFDRPIPFDRFGKIPVSYHDTDIPGVKAFSPNIARFELDPTRKVVTFWLIGIYDGQNEDAAIKKIYVSFNMLLVRTADEDPAKPSLVERVLEKQIKTSQTYPQLIEMFKKNSINFDKSDATALQTAAQVMTDALNPNPITIKAEQDWEIRKKAAEERERALAEKVRQDKAKADEVIRLKQQAEAQARTAAAAATKKKTVPAWQKPLLNAITKTQKDLARAQKPIKDAQTKLARAQRQAQQAQRAFNEAKRKRVPAKQLKQAQNKLQAAIKARNASKNALNKLTKDIKLTRRIQTTRKKLADAKKRLAVEIKKRAPKPKAKSKSKQKYAHK